MSKCEDPESVTNVEQTQKIKRDRLKVPCRYIIKEYNSYVNWVVINKLLKTTRKLDRKLGFCYHLSVCFDLIDSVAVKTHAAYKKDSNARIT